MCLKRVKKKKLLGRHNNYICKITVQSITFKKYRSNHRRCSIKNCCLKISKFKFTEKHLCLLESLFNSEYCKIFKNTYFEERLRKAASKLCS